jgi:hypothetical protein
LELTDKTLNFGKWIYINGIDKHVLADWAGTGIYSDPVFIAITKYLESVIKEVCNRYKMSLNKLYPIFIVPDDWREISMDLIHRMMIPILTEAGILFETEDYRDRALFIGESEAEIAYHQLNQYKIQLPFIHNENRCVMHTLYQDGGTIKLKSAYFQVKEDVKMNFFGERFYSLHTIHDNDYISILQENELKRNTSILKQFIFRNFLKMKHLITTRRDEESVADHILDAILSIFHV